MQSLLDREEVDTPLAELLEATGFVQASIFSSCSSEEIYSELDRANGVLKLVDELPTLEQIEEWKSLVAGESIQRSDTPDSNRSDLQMTRHALLLSDEFIELNEIEVEKLPKVEEEELIKSKLPPRSTSVKKTQEALPQSKLAVDRSRVKSLDDFRSHGSSVAPLDRRKDENYISSPKADINAGVDPNSRRYIRGVFHKDGATTYWGAIGYMIAVILLLLSAVPIIYILLKREDFYWGLLSPGLLLMALFLYLFVARRASCPVCRQRQFVPKACHKHVKAHTSPLLGYMIPTAWHLAFYKWFRCMFCGTSIRVKK